MNPFYTSKLFAEKVHFATGIGGALCVCRRLMRESQGCGEKWWGLFGFSCFSSYLCGGIWENPTARTGCTSA